MEAGKASRSAMGSGLLRAAHVREDRPPWVLEDTLSRQLLDAAEVAELEAAMAAWPSAVRQAFRVSHAVRARLAEDVAAAGLAADRRDYVLLGAGLDSFAWRHPRAGEFVVWEVDHPDTQAWKRAALRRAGLGEPSNVRFVAADLSATAIGDLETPARATWNWLGVTMYLRPEATVAALRTIAAGRAGTTLVVEFLLTPVRSTRWEPPRATPPRRPSRRPARPSWPPTRGMRWQGCWRRLDSAASTCSTPAGCGTATCGTGLTCRCTPPL
jgi:methyltransferase (TIGR00027 family)